MTDNEQRRASTEPSARRGVDLERAQTAVTKSGRPQYLTAASVAASWSFYVLQAATDGGAASVIRATSPTRALKFSRLITRFVGGQLEVMEDPLVGVDFDADAVVIGPTVHIFQPQRIERLFIDAEEIEKRAPQITAKFAAGIGAKLSPQTTTWIEKVCSENSNVGRRVERMNRTARLSTMSVDELREGLADAKLSDDTFGKAKTRLEREGCLALIDIAADLYYQPRFEANSRKVAQYRRAS